MKEIIIINIDGPIGAGKSTLANLIREKLGNVFIIEENVDSEDGKLIVEKYYADQIKYALEFDNFLSQSKKVRVQEIAREIEEGVDGTYYVIFDRSLKYDSIFTRNRYRCGFLNKEQFEELELIKKDIDKMCQETIPASKVHNLFLNIPFYVCLERIEKRKRHGEVISIDQNKALYDMHYEDGRDNDEVMLDMSDLDDIDKIIKSLK